MWFDELKLTLPHYYKRQHPLNIVGFLRGAGGPNQWRVNALVGHDQLIILGNAPPDEQDWINAGVIQRKRNQHAVLIQNIAGWIVLHKSGSRKPLGQLFQVNDDCLKTDFPESLEYWKRSYRQ